MNISQGSVSPIRRVSLFNSDFNEFLFLKGLFSSQMLLTLQKQEFPDCFFLLNPLSCPVFIVSDDVFINDTFLYLLYSIDIYFLIKNEQKFVPNSITRLFCLEQWFSIYFSFQTLNLVRYLRFFEDHIICKVQNSS